MFGYDVIITLWASYAPYFEKYIGAKIQFYTPGKLKIISKEPIPDSHGSTENYPTKCLYYSG